MHPSPRNPRSILPACLVVLVAASAVPASQDDRTLAGLSKARALRQKIDESKDDAERGTFQDEFDATVRSLAPTFAEVRVTTGDAPGPFTKVVLNARGRGFDAIRFTTPRADVPWDMYWEFVAPRGPESGYISSWYLMAREGTVRGFKDYKPRNDDKVPGVDAPSENLHVTQSLVNGSLRPGAEYLIWFSYGVEKAAMPTYVRITLVPEGSPPPAPRPPRGDEARSFGFDGPVLGVAFLPDGRRAVMAVDKVLHIGDAATGREVGKIETGHGVWSLAIARPSRDTALAATGSGDGNVRLWRLESGEEAAALSGHAGPVNVLITSPDGRRLLSGGADRTIRLWDVAAKREVRKFEGHSDEVYGLAFSPEGRRFVSAPGANDGVARVWDATSGQVVFRLEGHAGSVYGVAWSRDGRHILTGGADGTLRLWDAKTGREIRRFEAPGGDVNSVAFLPDGRRAVSAGVDKVVHLWDIATGRLERDYKGHTSWIGLRCLAVSPSGRLVLTGCSDRSARVWDVAGPVAAPATPKRPR